MFLTYKLTPDTDQNGETLIYVGLLINNKTHDFDIWCLFLKFRMEIPAGKKSFFPKHFRLWQTLNSLSPDKLTVPNQTNLLRRRTKIMSNINNLHFQRSLTDPTAVFNFEFSAYYLWFVLECFLGMSIFKVYKNIYICELYHRVIKYSILFEDLTTFVII